MRFVSWNIMAGGGPRCGTIVETLRRYDPDVITLQETVASRAADLCHVLRDAGYRFGLTAPRTAGDRGLCLLSRTPLRRVDRSPAPHAGIYPRGWLEADLVSYGVRLASVYGPAEGPRIAAYWDAAARWLRRRVARPFLMLGDFNAGASLVDGEAYRFKAGRAFAELVRIGLVDCWRRRHGDRREHTWFSHPGPARTGRGFRIDHAFASPTLAERLTECRYDHEVRERGWSDHSLLVVDLALERTATVASGTAAPASRARAGV